MRQADVMVLGTGPAATRVAIKCAEAGKDVAIADPRPYGGTCALRGCNPKRVLVRAAELYDWIARAEGTGVQVDQSTVDWGKLIAFKRSFTDPVTPWKEKKFDKAGITQLHGEPRFVSPNHVAVGNEELDCAQIVIATGAVPVSLDVPGWELLITSDDFLELDELPSRVVFVGGGYVTFEFAHVAARAGANVTIVELGPRPLPNFDLDLVDCLVDRTRELGIDLQVSTEVVAIESTSTGGYVVHTKSGQASSSFDTDMVVHGAGRVPNVAGLDLEAGTVRYGRQGIEVDGHLRSVSNPAVYAAGDVAATGAPALSPVASEEGRTLAHNLLEEKPRKPDYGPVPTVVFSVPALAAVGLGEKEARRQGLQFEVRSGDRARDNSMKKVAAKHARYKVLVEKSSDRILGAHLLGPDAAETINLFALAMKAGVPATEMKSTLFAFPTFAHDVRGML